MASVKILTRQDKTRQDNSWKCKYKVAAAVAFLAILAAGFAMLNLILQPVWLSWNNYDTMCGFYDEPKNSIETLFLGSSVAVRGIAPMEIYEDYGICSYNLATEQQPVMCSYFLLEECYRLQGKTLDTVVFEVKELNGTSDDAYYRKVLDAMTFSPIKIQAAKAYASSGYDNEGNDVGIGDQKNVLTMLLPLFAYRNRWKELGILDCQKMNLQPYGYLRGYSCYFEAAIDSASSGTDVNLPSYLLDQEEESAELNDESLEYFSLIVEFCKEHDIRLVLLKTPEYTGWTSANHIAIQKLADENELDFLDFNFAPYIDAIDYNPAIDMDNANGGRIKGHHLNYSGASKLSAYLGEYLANVCGNRDVRDDEKYAFMDDELAEYLANVADYRSFTDVADYLSYMANHNDYAVFISVKDDAAYSLTDEQREAFATIGLTGLANIGLCDSYLAVIGEGKVVYEELQSNAWPIDEQVAEGIKQTLEPIEYADSLGNGKAYDISSGGCYAGNTSSIVVGGTNYSPNARGINIVVWDSRSDELVDEVTFDTCASNVRASRVPAEQLAAEQAEGKSYDELSSAARKLYQFETYWEDYKKSKLVARDIADDDLAGYLDAFSGDEDYVIFLSSQGSVGEDGGTYVGIISSSGGVDISGSLDAANGDTTVFSYGDNENAHIYEQAGGADSSVSLSGNFRDADGNLVPYEVASDTDGTCSIKINNAECASSGTFDGASMNVVIYNTLTNAVVDARTFGISGQY